MAETKTQQLSEEELARWSHIGALAALALSLSYLETFVPIPLPGVKLGLANIAVLIALGQKDLRGACWVATIKVLASGLLFGSPVTMAYSAVGTALSLMLMIPLSRLRTMRLWMVSVVGALAHEAGQLLVAQMLLGTALVWYSAPVLLLAGCATGLLSGVIAERSLAQLSDANATEAEHMLDIDEKNDLAPLPSRGGRPGRVDPRFALLALTAFTLVTLRLTNPVHLALALLLSLAACRWAGVRGAELLGALRPTATICVITLLAQLLSFPPETAVLLAASSTLRLLALMCASLAFVDAQSRDELLHGFVWALTPLSLLGVNLAGPLHSLDVTLRLLPQIARAISRASISPSSLSQLIAAFYLLAEQLS